ncbi:CHAT domain-containing protein [Limnospira sp. PMC 917.15]|uniref:CHAT domain-containing protein n=1 Tax=Limnospira sp. PMC 917.15 TaxID=2981106 RepID=UPI0028E16DBA|nr:CHAT domain-containing protein [Limnospira sp. PMC 917.15]MDT9234229.1 CHAT domain-containing protein [Limnospira sp. PMC 917.15]
MDEQRVQAYLSLIQEVLTCPSGEEPDILNGHLELVDEGFVQVCEQVAAQLQQAGQDNLAGFLRNVAQQVGAFLAQRGTGGNQQAALQQFWRQLLQAERQGGTTAVHQVMRPNMGLIVPALGDVIAQFLQGFLAQNPGRAEEVAGLVEDTCSSIQQFPYGRYGEALEIAIRGYGVVLELGIYTPQKRAQTLTNLGVARSTQAEMGIDPTANLERAITAYDEASGIRQELGLDKDLSSTLTNLGNARLTQAEMGINPTPNLERAIASHDEASGILRQLGLDKDLSGSLNNLGVARYTQANMGIDPTANLERAITAYDEASGIMRRLELDKDLSTTLNNLGSARLTQANMGIDPTANLERAITAYNEAAGILRELGLDKDLSRTLTGLGNARLTQANMGIKLTANLERAITAIDEAAAIMRRLELDKDLSGTLTNLGLARVTQANMGINPPANLESAIAAYNEAAGILRKLGLDKDLCDTLTNLGLARVTQANMGINPPANLESALAAYDEAEGIQRRLGLNKDLSSTLIGLGNACHTKAEMGIKPAENLESAIAAYNEAAGIVRKLGLDKDLSATLAGFGNARRTQANMGINPTANLESAIAAHDEASRIMRELGLDKDLSSTLNNLGVARLTQAMMGINPTDNLKDAITAYDEASEIRRELGLDKDLSTTLTNLGVARYTQAMMGIDPTANLERAITAYDEAARMRRRLKLDKDLSDTLTNFGNARLTQAMMGINPTANLESALAAYDEASRIMRKLGLDKDLSTTLTSLGVARKTQAEMGIDPTANLERAIAAYDEATGIMRRLGLARDLATTLNNFGFAYQAQSRLAGNSSTQTQQALENAYRSFQEALDQVEYLRGEIGADSEGYKRNFNEQWNKVYRGMVEVCLELGRYQDAIEYVDRSKARNLVELIATRDAYPGGVIPENTRQQLQSLKLAIYQEERRLQQEENPDRTHLNQLRQQKQQLEPYKPLHFQGMQELLDEETAILEWYILPDKFLTFTLTAQSLNLWTSSQEDLDKLIDWGNAYLNDYRNRDNSQWRETLAQRLEELAQILHLDEILQNLRQNFPNCQKLILIPHRFLHLFPLHALPVHLPSFPNPLLLDGEKGANFPSSPLYQVGRGAGGEGSEGKFLQDLFPKGVTYAPNCQLLQQAQSRPRLNFKRLFAIQNPTEDLGWADVEIETIRTLFPNPDILETEKATTAKLLDNQRQELLRQTHHLYFSCHAAFNPTSPLDSGLLLADGVLTLENIIAKLNLSNCSLVTLSACETGQVAVDRTDEYISLSSGFILAGSPSVLVSLWSVNQVSTALLLIRTYELLQQQPGQLAQSLQAAQKWLRETTVKGFEQWRQQCPLFSEEWRAELKPIFAQMGQNKEEGVNHRPYQSPYHWAAFCIVGEGEQNYG